MRKYILIVLVLLFCAMLTQDALAVDLLDAEDFRIEVVARPYYEQVGLPPYMGGVYCVDIIAVNDSKDVIDLRGLSSQTRVVALEENVTNLQMSFSYLKGIPKCTQIKPHSKIVLQSFVVTCNTSTREEPSPGTVITTISPVSDILIIVNGLCNNRLVFSSSAHVKYDSVTGRGTEPNVIYNPVE